MAECTVCVDRAATRGACPCGHAPCRACERRCVLEHARAAACVGCGRAWDAEEAVARLGKTFWSTAFRRMRRRELRVREQPRLRAAEREAARLREERRLRAAVRELRAGVARGTHDELAPVLRRAEHDLYAAVHRRVEPHARAGGDAHCAHCAAPLHAQQRDAAVRCGACARSTCTACGEECAAAGHVCDPAALASRRAIRRDCKPCVRCAAPSMRTEGCSVMWCPHCHTFWNWETERIVEARGAHAPHNPDHRAFLARGGALRELDDVPCGGLPDGVAVHHAFVRDAAAVAHLAYLAPVVIDALGALHEAQRVLRARFPRAWTEDELFRRARLAFAVGDTTEVAYEASLERLERDAHFKRDVGFALELFVLAGADAFQRMCAGADDVVAVCAALTQLRLIVDGRLASLAATHTRKAPRLTPAWRWT